MFFWPFFSSSNVAFRSSFDKSHFSSRPPLRRSLSLLVCLLTLQLALSDAFILQELPLYRSIRDDRSPQPLATRSSATVQLMHSVEDTGPTFFIRPSRAFNFQRLNRLRDYWHRKDFLRRLSQSRLMHGPEGAFWKK